MPDQTEALRKFTALPLREKLTALIDAAVDLELRLHRAERRQIGHPGEFCGDYNDEIARRMLGIATLEHDCPSSTLRCWIGVVQIWQDAYLPVSAIEASSVSDMVAIHYALHDYPGPRAVGIISGIELTSSRTGGGWMQSAISTNALVWKALQTGAKFESAFLAAYGFVRNDPAALSNTDYFLSRLTVARREFSCGGHDWIGYAAGLEVS